jgi:acyl transferase domain-containing protein
MLQYPSRGAHYLEEDVSLFDAPFFSLSADEAAALDPQQRHLLEVTYRALENGRSYPKYMRLLRIPGATNTDPQRAYRWKRP